jgi:hypothetical protein
MTDANTERGEALRLHPATSDLVDRFAAALKEKLAKAEAKYGYSDGWSHSDWSADLVRKLVEHVQKGDPRDVAAYCAFAWHHGWSITPGEAKQNLADPGIAEGCRRHGGFCKKCGYRKCQIAPTEATQAASRNAGEGEAGAIVRLNAAANGWSISTEPFDPEIVGVLRSDLRAILARHAPVEAGEPVAWLLTHPTEPTDVELASSGEPITDADRQAGWDAEPLYRRPLQAEAPMGEQS